VVNFKPLAPHYCGVESNQELLIVIHEKVIQLAYRKSVLLLRCPFLPEIMHRGASDIFLHGKAENSFVMYCVGESKKTKNL
jgi:hypothetical protein